MVHVIDAAIAKGWTVVKQSTVRGNGIQAPGAVVLSRIDNDLHPFVVHFYNEQDGGFYYGDYCKTYYEADAAYSRKQKLYRAGVQEDVDVQFD